ncbi:MAG: hypothetical protein ACERLG_11230 [Sedimentibacter sp.]
MLTTKIPDIAVKCNTLDRVDDTLLSLDKALSPAMEGISMEERDVKNEEGKNNRGSTIPLIIPKMLMADSGEIPNNNNRAGIMAFSTVLKIEFMYDVPDRGRIIVIILKIILLDLAFAFFE